MSGPHDSADDPDEVTLWAGRLRPWPAAPRQAGTDDGDVDEDTVRSPRRGDGSSTVIDADEATVRSPRDELDELDDDTVVVHARGEAASELDEVTRRRPPSAPEVDERTRRRGEILPEVDQVTRRRQVPAADPDDATLRRPSGEPDDTTAPRARERSATVDGASELDDDTTAGRRRTGPAAPPIAAAGASDVPGAIRDASVPIALDRQTYAPRTQEPARVERRHPAPASRADEPVVRARSASRGVRRALLVSAIVVVAATVVVVAALLLFA